MTKSDKIKAFNPSGYAVNENLFGLPFNEEESEVIVIPVPWEVTVSYSQGTANAPKAIKEASLQVDLYDPFIKEAWKHGIFMKDIDAKLLQDSTHFRSMAESYLNNLFEGKKDEEKLHVINSACEQMIRWVKETTHNELEKGKKVVLLGGDHSTPLGYIETLASRYSSFGILQIDAHADLRDAYEGFTYSHASIMFNALQNSEVERLVQVGIRDYCEEEVERINNSKNRIVCFFDRDLKHDQYRAVDWSTQCEHIVSQLPQKVYVSFDIDGLNPNLCPNTGTPVAGGFDTEEVLFLLEKVVESGREIIGIDLNEVAPGQDEWDANVGARLLYRLCNLMHYKKEGE